MHLVLGKIASAARDLINFAPPPSSSTEVSHGSGWRIISELLVDQLSTRSEQQLGCMCPISLSFSFSFCAYNQCKAKKKMPHFAKLWEKICSHGSWTQILISGNIARGPLYHVLKWLKYCTVYVLYTVVYYSRKVENLVTLSVKKIACKQNTMLNYSN